MWAVAVGEYRAGRDKPKGAGSRLRWLWVYSGRQRAVVGSVLTSVGAVCGWVLFHGQVHLLFGKGLDVLWKE